MVKQITFKNKIFSKKELKEVVYTAFTQYGITRTCLLADEIKNLGFNYATKAGISISIEDLKIPPTKKELLLDSNNQIKNSDLSFLRGEINAVERFQKVIDTWNNASETLKTNLVNFFNKTDPLNPIYLMAFSGARGNLSQVRQLVGMRGLMSDPNGQIIDIPIIHNFREGLTITDYIMSAYGARKGVVDTALRTADSGYLTRRLIDVAQDVIIREYDCNTSRSIKIYLKENNSIFVDKILGRTCAESIFSDSLSKPIVSSHQSIDELIIENLLQAKINSIKIFSPLTCESTRSICQKCYGWDLSNCKLVALGEAIGIIAAQSIGEPGTQLTMRTFHTGGIFTADASRQIIAKQSGLFSLSDNIPLKPSRTLYGSTINILERESLFRITDYSNTQIESKLPADSFIFIPSNTFVKKGQLIAELPYKNQQTIESRKNIIAPHSGEIIFSSDSNLIWILEGEVYDIPLNSLFNKFTANQQISLKDNLFSFKLISRTSGILKIIKDKIYNNIEILQISNCLKIFNKYPIFWDKKKKKIVLSSDFNNNQIYYLLETLPPIVKQNNFLFAQELNTKYKTSTGGHLIFSNKNFFEYDSIYQKEIIVKNGKILFLPLEVYKINKDKSLLLVANRTKLTSPGTEIISGLFSLTDGFVQIKEFNQIVQEVEIKPGNFFEFLSLNDSQIEDLKKLDKKIYFPGEVIFEDILVKEISLAEVTKTKNYFVLILRPINIYNIPKSNTQIKANFSSSLKIINFNHLNYLNFNSSNIDDFRKPFNLINSTLWFENKNLKIGQKTGFSFKLLTSNSIGKANLFLQKSILNFKNIALIKNDKSFISNWSNLNYFSLALVSEETINIPNVISKKLNDEILKLSLFFQDLDYIEKRTILGKISLIPKKEFILENFKSLSNQNLKTLFVTKKNYQTFFTENVSFLKKQDEMVKVGDEIKPFLKIGYSGKVTLSNSFKLILHRGTPFFVTPSTKLYIKSGDFIKQDELIGVITYKQVVTGDIVQGLPKIEEILEARKSQNPAFLSESPGIIASVTNLDDLKQINIYTNNLTSHLSNGEEKVFLKTFENIENNIIVKKNQFIFVGQPLTEGSVNPHNLLITYFNYYKNFTNDHESAYLSFKNLQLLLIEKVQQVYINQGVTIADKHLEVIVKRMTSKVQISESGDSFLLPGEILELKQIHYINQILQKSRKKVAVYLPILMGITKASLLSDSFISAASFQETTKILTSAAIEGKIDWLRGLKENVILGRLIPVGTGFIEETPNKF
jgi:DNA-directed RNA polymerase subunit beta'